MPKHLFKSLRQRNLPLGVQNMVFNKDKFSKQQQQQQEGLDDLFYVIEAPSYHTIQCLAPAKEDGLPTAVEDYDERRSKQKNV